MTVAHTRPEVDVEITAAGGMYLTLDSLALNMLPADPTDEDEIRANLAAVELALMDLAKQIPTALDTVREQQAILDGTCRYCSAAGELHLPTVGAFPCDWCDGTGKRPA